MIERAGGVAHSQAAGGYSVPCGNFLYKFLTSIYIYIYIERERERERIICKLR